MKFFFNLMLAGALLIILFGFSASAHAEEPVGYSVEPQIPENQRDKKQTYFDLRMKPGQKQELSVTIWNSSNEESKIKASINNPITNHNGIVDYSKPDAELDESLKLPITKIASLKEEIVTVPANSSKNIVISLDMPDGEFDGVILGGIYFEKVLEEEDNKAGVQIQNNYAYTVGLMLSENDKPIKPELVLKAVEPTLVNYRTSIIAQIQNSKAMILKDLTMNASVLTRKGDEIAKVQQHDISMAPNSMIDFPINWDKEFDPGTYILKMAAKYGDQIWNWEEEFEIKRDEALQLNDQAVNSLDNQPPFINGGYSLIIVLLLAVIFWLVRKNRKINHSIN